MLRALHGLTAHAWRARHALGRRRLMRRSAHLIRGCPLERGPALRYGDGLSFRPFPPCAQPAPVPDGRCSARPAERNLFDICLRPARVIPAITAPTRASPYRSPRITWRISARTPIVNVRLTKVSSACRLEASRKLANTSTLARLTK